MTLENFKNIIHEDLLKFFPEDYPCFIFVYEDNPFIAKQYIEALADAKSMETQYIESLVENPFFTIEEPVLNIYNASSLQDIKQFPKNTVILCAANQAEIDKLPNENKLDGVIENGKIKHLSNVDWEPNKHYIVINFPKPKDWQLKDYIAVCCQGLNQKQIDFIYTTSQGDTYSIQSWVDKIRLFDTMVQSEVFDFIIDSNNYFVLDPWIEYKLASAIMKKDKNSIANLLKTPNKTFEPFTLLSILRKTLYNIMCIQMDGTTTADTLGLKYNQFKALSYSCNKFSNKKLIELFKFLNSIDSQIKLGKLMLNDKQLLDYIVLNMWR